MTRDPSKLPRPHPDLRASVVVPAREEGDTLTRCLAGLAAQRGVASSSYEVIVVCPEGDEVTLRALKEAAAVHPHLALLSLFGDGPGPGTARRLGMDAAAGRLFRVGRPRGLVATTDADSVVAPDWLVRQLEAVERGAEAIGGSIELDPAEGAGLPPQVLAWRDHSAAERLERVRRDRLPGDVVEHHHFAGASMALTARAYRRVGGLPHTAALEDEGLERALRAAGIPILRLTSVRVSTSARTDGRAPRGLARDLRAAAWLQERTFAATDFDPADLARIKTDTVALVLPTLNVAGTLPRILDEVGTLREVGLLDDVIVIDAGSSDGSADLVRSRGLKVVDESELMSGFGPPRGKGDALWRALSATGSDIVAFVDTDTANFDASFVTGLLGPLVTEPGIALVKGAFRRPLQVGDRYLPDEGGRVTELVARPLLNLYAPELAVFDQPLAGETAARRELLDLLPFPVGYGVEIALLLDTWKQRGLWAMAQVDLGERRNRHQSLEDLGPMAYAVMVAAARRLHGDGAPEHPVPGPYIKARGRDLRVRNVPVEERPPMASVTGARRPPRDHHRGAR